ncbi:MAG: endonuclease/exonuclease/phosphatase [Rhodopirellula sp.]|nr:endonuclease/exonuclease/phosphatase [Rhodopirellula sp.]OUX51493.1 MAG: endonuclease/exonuclease/phosphatase [Rhodopirellula sp. TMED283]
MNFRLTRFQVIAAILLISGCSPLRHQELFAQNPTQIKDEADGQVIRIATFNASLYGKQTGQVLTRLRGGKNRQAIDLASIVQSVRPDILLVNEIDYDTKGMTVNAFGDEYLEIDQNELLSIKYPYRYPIPSNTGKPSMLDLDGNGKSTDANDAWGYGVYPGQYAMAVYSRFPIVESEIRTFQNYRWSQLPNALRPTLPATGKSYYTDEVWEQLRLSSKNHTDVPIQVGTRIVHLLASHPTPPVFDGPDDHNGCRNHDEIRFWNDYLAGPSAIHLVDDDGNSGGLPDKALFVIAGDLNSDPESGDSRRSAIQALLKNNKLHDSKPVSVGASESTGKDNSLATAFFGKSRQMRIDYVLPSRGLALQDTGVFWPSRHDRKSKWLDATDHRMVWIEVELRP